MRFDPFRWRGAVRVICLISWAISIPMFFVPEPVRNETNKLAQEELKAKAELETFGNLPLRDGEQPAEQADGTPMHQEGDPTDG